ncbi:DNA methyltransferase [Nitrosomonas sp.]|uniref:DNA methyltransferase n=1 Tax=Nitrosomonas sp. TaxID=42353 RepID=UPI003A5C50F3
MWITIDDNEAHYLKVLCDEVFGRANFVANVVWQKKYAVANDHKTIAPMHDHVLVYRKSEKWERKLIPRTEAKDRQYKFEDEKGVFRFPVITPVASHLKNAQIFTTRLRNQIQGKKFGLAKHVYGHILKKNICGMQLKVSFIGEKTVPEKPLLLNVISIYCAIRVSSLRRFGHMSTQVTPMRLEKK